MKINKYPMIMLALSAAMWSCSDSVDYSPAEPVGGARVYFAPDDNGSEILLADGQESVTVAVYRKSSDGSITVPVESVDESGLFDVATSVTFADGETESAIDVSFDFSDIVPNTVYPLTLTLTGDDVNVDYATASITVNITFSPWSEWEQIGTASYYNSFFGTTESDQPFYSRRSLVSDAVQYSVGDGVVDETVSAGFLLYYGVQFMFERDSDGNLHVSGQMIDDSGYEFGYIDTQDAIERWPGIGLEDIAQPSTFDESTGLYSLSVTYYDYYDAVGDFYPYNPTVDYVQLDGYDVYGIELTEGGNYVDTDGNEYKLVGFYKVGETASYKYAAVAGQLSEEEVSGIADDIDSEAIASVSASDDGWQMLRFDDNGYYTVVAAGYSESGEYKTLGYTTFYYQSVVGGAITSEWESLGLCDYTDALLSHALGYDAPTYPVEVEANVYSPGYYRIVDPYGADSAYPYKDLLSASTDEVPGYILINAVNPSAIYIEETNVGVQYDGSSDIWVTSLAAYYLTQGYTLEDLASWGYCGEMQDDVITFPYYLGDYEDNGTYVDPYGSLEVYISSISEYYLYTNYPTDWRLDLRGTAQTSVAKGSGVKKAPRTIGKSPKHYPSVNVSADRKDGMRLNPVRNQNGIRSHFAGK